MHDGKKEIIGIPAGADLSSMQYKCVVIAGTIAAESDTALGVLQNKPQSGEDASVAWSGHMKGVGGTALTVGTRLKVTTSGYLIAVASGDGTAVGKVVTACASGGLAGFVGNFANANTTYNQL